MSFHKILALGAFAAFILASEAHRVPPKDKYDNNKWARKMRCEKRAPLVCDFAPTKGNSVSGRVVFTTKWHCGHCLVRVSGSISGLRPNGRHGWHIHAYGDLSLRDGSATGGHFTNPRLDAIPHGFPYERPRHWGDLGNLSADGNGRATYDRIDFVIQLRGIVGRGMIVHALSDKGSEAQPTGGAGARQAQCVIGYANPARL